MNLTEEKIDELGSFLEHNGFTDDGIDSYFLEHFGVKGMRWGQRRTAKIQKHIDKADRVARGEATRKEVGQVGRRLGSFNSRKTQGRAQVALRRGAELQRTIGAGRMSVTNTLLKAQGIRIQDINYHTDVSNAPIARRTVSAREARRRIDGTSRSQRPSRNGNFVTQNSFGRNMAIGIVGGAAGGLAIGSIINRSIPGRLA